MDPKSQEMFDIILTKDVNSLSEEESQFLLARRDYLNDADKKRYADIIKSHESDAKSGKLGKSADGLDEMKPDALKALAKKEKVDIKGLTTKPEIVAAIRQARVVAEAGE